MPNYRGGKYDVLISSGTSIGTATSQSYTTPNKLFTSDLTAPADGLLRVKALSTIAGNIAYIVLNSTSGVLFTELPANAMSANVFYTHQPDIPVFNGETINFTFSKTATITLEASFIGVIY